MHISCQTPSDRSSQMLAALKPGSVVVDLAAENGGNCVATVPGQLVEHNGVTVIGLSDPQGNLTPSNNSNRIHRSPLATPDTVIYIIFEQYYQIPPLNGTRRETLRS